ncbi:MAG: hypothetical protein AAB503_02860 [Patescibacteria group bacterium]
METPNIPTNENGNGSGSAMKIIVGIIVLIIVIVFVYYYGNKEQAIPELRVQAPTEQAAVIETLDKDTTGEINQQIQNIDLGNINTDLKGIDDQLKGL